MTIDDVVHGQHDAATPWTAVVTDSEDLVHSALFDNPHLQVVNTADGHA
jgi:hypothetical protein